MLRQYLDDLESRIDPHQEDKLLNEWKQFASGNFTGELFSPRRDTPKPSTLEWPSPTVNQALDDFDMMVLQQLRACSDQLAAGSGWLMNVRANYGTPILPSLFGVKLYRMDEALNTLPASWPIDGIDKIRSVIDQGIPDLHQSLGAMALDTSAKYAELFAEYPNISKYVTIYHPDLQGPMDLCEMLWGSSIFVDSYDYPELLHQLLQLVTDTYRLYMHEWEHIIPPRSDGYAVHWGMLIKGRIMLRDDSAMNFSPAMYQQFSVPYEQLLLDEFGGGAIHFCGRGSHFVPAAAAMRGLSAINASQPELNDMEAIYQATVDHGINIISLAMSEAMRALQAGRPLHSRVHAV